MVLKQNISSLKSAGKRFSALIFLLCSLLPLSAQEVFTDHVRSKESSKGTVLIIQDAEIEDLVNGVKKHIVADAPKEGEDAISSEATTPAKKLPSGKALTSATNGYRIQIYSGGNSRADKQAAERAQMLCKREFPQLSTYVHFISPRWTCRVGNFPTTKSAEKYMEMMRKSGHFKAVSLVRCKIVARQ